MILQRRFAPTGGEFAPESVARFIGIRKLGSPKEALEEYKKAWDSAVEGGRLNWQRAVLHFRGLAYLEMNAIDEAQKAADELKEMIEKGMNKKHIRYYHHLVGNIELKRESFSKAIEYFKEAISLLPSQSMYPSQSDLGDDHALFIDSLALTYYKAGDLDRAREEYEKILSLTTGRLSFGDIYAKSFYMLAKLYEQKGWRTKAIEHYNRFLSLWKDADPGIAEVEDARMRLAGLREMGDK